MISLFLSLSQNMLLYKFKAFSIFTNHLLCTVGFRGGDSGKEPACQCRSRKRFGFSPWVGKNPWKTFTFSLRRHRRLRFDPWLRKIPWKRAWRTHTSILAWRILWTEEPGGLQSIGLQSQRRLKQLNRHPPCTKASPMVQLVKNLPAMQETSL